MRPEYLFGSATTAAGAGILGTGSYLPDRAVSNADLAARVPGADADWISRKTHIGSRRVDRPPSSTQTRSAGFPFTR